MVIMGNTFFKFKDFTIHQDRCAMKVCTDASMFGVWARKFVLEPSTLLDIGAGTGLLSLLIASAKEVKIDAIELDTEAALQATENIVASDFRDRIDVISTDIKNFHSSKRYDLIFSNPPFFENDLHSPDLNSNLAKHSTALSLDELFISADRLMHPKGAFAILLPFHRKDELLQLAEKRGFYPHAILDVKQTPNHSYFRTMVYFKKERASIVEHEMLSIQEGATYSAAFKTLMKDVYFKSLD